MLIFWLDDSQLYNATLGFVVPNDGTVRTSDRLSTMIDLKAVTPFEIEVVSGLDENFVFSARL